MPYGQLDLAHAFSTSRFHGLISFLSSDESYMPDRCCRQYSCIQTIPRAIIMPAKAHRPEKVKEYVVEYDPARWVWNARDTHSIRLDLMGPPVIDDPSAVVQGYMEWFLPRTHPYVSPPIVILHIAEDFF